MCRVWGHKIDDIILIFSRKSLAWNIKIIRYTHRGGEKSQQRWSKVFKFMFIKPRKVREGEIFLHFRWGSSGMMRMKRRREKETLRRNPIKMRKWNFRTRKYDGRLILSQCFSSALGKMLGNCDDLWSHERGNCGRMLSVEEKWGRKGMCSTFECHSLPLFFMCEKLLQAFHSMLLRNRNTSTSFLSTLDSINVFATFLFFKMEFLPADVVVFAVALTATQMRKVPKN